MANFKRAPNAKLKHLKMDMCPFGCCWSHRKWHPKISELKLLNSTDVLMSELNLFEDEEMENMDDEL